MMKTSRASGAVRRVRWAVVLGIGLLASALARPASAQLVCSQLTPSQLAQDEDRDGFSNGQECQGILLDAAGWSSTSPFRNRSFPHVSPTGCAAAECVDVNRKDVFVFTVPLASGGVIGSALPQTAFLKLLKNEPSLKVHELRSTNDADFPADRRVTAASPQPGVKIVESNDVSGVDLGFCFKSPPTVSGVAFVYVQRIRNRVNGQCAPGDTCRINDPTTTATPEQIVAAVTEWVANHETLHCLDVTTLLDAATGSYHLPTVTTTPPAEQSSYIHKVRTKQRDELFTIPVRIDPSTPPSVRTN